MIFKSVKVAVFFNWLAALHLSEHTETTEAENKKKKKNAVYRIEIENMNCIGRVAIRFYSVTFLRKQARF